MVTLWLQMGASSCWAEALSIAKKTLPRADAKGLHQPGYQSTAAQPDEPRTTAMTACLHE